VTALKYRSKLRISIDILTIIAREGGETGPTRILYGANLSHDRLMTYLENLKELGLIEEMKGEDEKTTYRLLDKGVSLLSEFRKIDRLAEAFGVSI